MASKRQLTVLQILPDLQGGGVERGTLEVAAELVRRGHRSLVISGGGRMVAELERMGSEHTTWAIGRKSLATLKYVRPLQHFIQEQGVDIIHLRSRVPAWVAWLAWRGIPEQRRPHWVSTVHGLHSVSRYSAIVTRGERVIAVSETVKRYILESYPQTPAACIRVIHRGVDRTAFPRGYQPEPDWFRRWNEEFKGIQGKRVLTLAGRLTRLKGHSFFIDLVSALKLQGFPVHGLIVGGEDPRRQSYAVEMRQKVADLGLGGDITFTGHRSDIREIYAISDLVFSLSTKPESFGRTVVEALSLGRPVIGYDHGGVGEILEKLFPQGRVPLNDSKKLQAVTASLLESPQPVPEFDGFTLQEMLDKTLALYEELVG
ncbi:MAG: glycosyltransferase family 4 protein [Gammaproteobacteria bacterium]|nr:glycosyltransferase family 4 protein [Gammaproteobacteria bacterium]